MSSLPVHNPSNETEQHAKHAPSRSCTKKKILIGIAAAVIGIVLFVYFFVTKEDLAKVGIITIDEDPFDGEVYAWVDQYVSSDGKLKIGIINAMEEKYDRFFNVSANAWQNGEPDVLDFQVKKVPHDPVCNSRSGVIMVCNDDYGATGWEGLNTILMRGTKIISSVAYMNDYYLDGSLDSKKEYTMCHELGHGLGLPHTDTSFWNLDEGNCMDYTSRKRNNRKPGIVSFERLAALYGPPQDQDNVPVISSLERTNKGVEPDEANLVNYTGALQEFDILCNKTLYENATSPYAENEMDDGYKMIIFKKLAI